MAPLPSITMLKRQSQSSCLFDESGAQTCNGWSYGARIGVGVAIIAGLAIMFLGLSILARRRRNARMSNITPALHTTTVMPYQPQTENSQWDTFHGGQSNVNTPQTYYPPPPQHKTNYFGPPAGPPPDLEEPYYPDAPSVPPPSYQRKEGNA